MFDIVYIIYIDRTSKLTHNTSPTPSMDPNILLSLPLPPSVTSLLAGTSPSALEIVDTAFNAFVDGKLSQAEFAATLECTGSISSDKEVEM